MAAIDLPDDLVFRILLFLPVASLLRFKSVCKSWLKLIQTPGFTYQHLHLHHHDSPSFRHSDYKPLMFNPHGSYGDGLPELYFFSPDNFHLPPLCSQIDLHYDYPLYHVNIITCNGIICVHINNNISNKHVSLWNPVTKQLRHLPQSPFQHPSTEFCVKPTLAFGFDANTNNFKVLRIFSSLPLVKHIEIYSLATDSWTMLPSVLPVDGILSDCTPRAPYRNHIYCWVARKGRAVFQDDRVLISPNVILLFDFTQQLFQTMHLPDVDTVNACCTPDLCIIRDNLACITTDGLPRYCDIWVEIWVQNEFGVQQSWSMLHKLAPFQISNLIGISKDGNYLLYATDWQLRRYHLLTRQITTLPLQTDLFHTAIINSSTLYKESLVLLE